MAFSFAGFYKSLDLKTKKAAGFLPAAFNWFIFQHKTGRPLM